MYVFSVINRKVVLSLLISVCILFLSICVYAHTNLSENNPVEIPVPILMYHSILKDPLRAGAYGRSAFFPRRRGSNGTPSRSQARPRG